MKTLKKTAFLSVLLCLLSAPASAQVESEWLLADNWTGLGRPLDDGTRVDIRFIDVSSWNVYVQFSWDSPNLITEYIDRIEWKVQHTGWIFLSSL